MVELFIKQNCKGTQREVSIKRSPAEEIHKCKHHLISPYNMSFFYGIHLIKKNNKIPLNDGIGFISQR